MSLSPHADIPSAGSLPPRRTRRTRPSVFWMDVVARLVITLGGIGTIAAVIAVAVFLFAVAIPLFFPPTIEAKSSFAIDLQDDWRLLATDSEKLIGVGITAKGRLLAWSHQAGEKIIDQMLEAAGPSRSLSQSVGMEDFYLGRDDGSIQRGQVRFEESFPSESEIPAADSIETGMQRIEPTGLITRTKSGKLRRTKVNVSLDPPMATGSASPIVSIDHIARKPGTLVVSVHKSGEVLLHDVVTKPAPAIVTHVVSLPTPAESPLSLGRLFSKGNKLLLTTRQGTTYRFEIKSLSEPKLVEGPITRSGRDANSDAVPGAEWVVGRETLVERSNHNGEIHASFLVRDPADPPTTADGLEWTQAKELSLATQPTTSAMAVSTKLRLAAAARENQSIDLFQVTTGQKIASVKLRSAGPVTRLAFSPSDDALLVGQPDGCTLMTIDLRHPEATPSSLFRPVRYESYDRPAHVWQSDSAGGAEPKFGMIPLIFGSIKATVYSMLFGAPLALLAAIYTSEFLSKSTKARVKPTIELMAGLPSVVLGFVAAMVLAPLVSRHLLAVLLSFIAVPLSYLLLGHLWQLLPQAVTLRLAGIRFLLMIVTLPVGLLLAQTIAPLIETNLFSGDVKLWLDGQVGSAIPGWTFLMLPISAVVVGWLLITQIDPVLRPRLNQMSRFQAGTLVLIRFLAAVLATFVIAALFASLMTLLGWDPRGTLVDTYIQRNSLVVGFVMGFAIIPIIYTLADDALSTVPENLRSASLGAGATPWQTAILIVVPAAMSGLFSAVMVGLGRAVGETMIVLMAAGSSPITEWNIFNGFRTLSANIAIELPEAVQGSTHYRILFFAAVVLFVLTSVLNTVAEIVRMRFRKRAVQL
ncbi:ABC transporter permease subunit [bacterium]|nr:ABC transporter permease subunit [bacterium]